MSITLPQLEWLQSDEGARLLAAIRDLDPQPTSGLAVIAKLRKQYPPEMVAAGMSLHQLRQKSREKFADADAMWFTRDGLEQATSEAIARHRATRFEDTTNVADLCCGIGGDARALAALPGLRSLTIVDRDPVHLAMARVNLALANPAAEVRAIQADVRKVKLAPFDAVFIDPARRDEQGRHATGRSEPPLAWCVGVANTVPAVGIKLAPGLPHDLIPDGWEFETIALGFDLKEAVLWSPALARGTVRATVIDADGAHPFAPFPGDPVPERVPVVGEWVYDPNPAITRAGLVEDLARTLGTAKIDPQIAFLVASDAVDTPFARRYRVLASLPWHERNVKQAVFDLDGGPVDVRRRGLPGNVDEIQRRIRGTGSRPLWIAMTRVADRPWAIIAET